MIIDAVRLFISAPGFPYAVCEHGINKKHRIHADAY
jgi:hypothetical protein